MRVVALAALGVVSLCAETPAELEKLLATAAEPGVVMVEIARQYAIAGDRQQALAWFQKAAALNPEYTPEFDRDFETMAALPGFQALVERARKASPPVRRGALAFTVAESDLIPEGLAWDARSQKLYLGSVNKRKIVEIGPGGAVRDLIGAGQDGIGSVLGMKVDPTRRIRDGHARAGSLLDFGEERQARIGIRTRAGASRRRQPGLHRRAVFPSQQLDRGSERLYCPPRRAFLPESRAR
jgi:hypothetical protein